MSEHPSAVRYRQMTAAMTAGDLSEFGDLLADNVEWWEMGSSEPIRGRDAVIERFSFFTDFDVSIDLHDVVANDDHLIALLNVTATKNGEAFNYQTAEIMHLNAEGRVAERWAFARDTGAILDFFG